MALQQVSLSGVIICPALQLGQRLAVNSFTLRIEKLTMIDALQ
jgi:hypothetical protein